MTEGMAVSKRKDKEGNLIPLCPNCRKDTLQERHGKYGQFFCCINCGQTTNRNSIERKNYDGYDDADGMLSEYGFS